MKNKNMAIKSVALFHRNKCPFIHFSAAGAAHGSRLVIIAATATGGLTQKPLWPRLSLALMQGATALRRRRLVWSPPSVFTLALGLGLLKQRQATGAGAVVLGRDGTLLLLGL